MSTSPTTGRVSPQTSTIIEMIAQTHPEIKKAGKTEEKTTITAARTLSTMAVYHAPVKGRKRRVSISSTGAVFHGERGSKLGSRETVLRGLFGKAHRDRADSDTRSVTPLREEKE